MVDKPHALVTGGSRGIGRAVAERLARDGFNVSIVARSRQALDLAAGELGRFGVSVKAYACDLGAWHNGSALIAEVEREAGRLDLLVNGAGEGNRVSIHGLTEEALQSVFSSKFTSTVSLITAAWPLLMRTRGQVINIIGALAHTPSEKSLVGSAVCGALAGFTKALAEQGRHDGVRVNAVHPGWIDTGRLESQLNAIATRDGHRDLERARASLLAEIRMTRIGTADDVAALVGFLASPGAELIHGAGIDVDGGMTKGL